MDLLETGVVSAHVFLSIFLRKQLYLQLLVLNTVFLWDSRIHV